MMEWQPIDESAPRDEPHIRGVWVHNNVTGKDHWEQFIGSIKSDDEYPDEFVDHNGDDFGWQPEDYTHWITLPEPPSQ